MANLELPTRLDLPAYNYRVTLEGTVYTLFFTYNQRMGKWILGLGDEQGNLLVAGVPLIANWPLFFRFKDEGLPPGDIAAHDSSGQSQDPGRFDLGGRVRIYYREAG